jgi:hypothetical protein
MNYFRIYEELVMKGYGRKKGDGVYLERHHIKPKCLGGTDSKTNLTFLTGREHFVAHLLLTKMHPENDRLMFALNCMLRSKKYQNRKLSSYEIGLAKSKFAKLMSERGKMRVGYLNSNFGNYWTDEMKSNLSQKKKGTMTGNANPAKRQDVRDKLKISKRGKGNGMSRQWILICRKTNQRIELFGGVKRFLSEHANSSYFKLLSGTDPNFIYLV